MRDVVSVVLLLSQLILKTGILEYFARFSAYTGLLEITVFLPVTLYR